MKIFVFGCIAFIFAVSFLGFKVESKQEQPAPIQYRAMVVFSNGDTLLRVFNKKPSINRFGCIAEGAADGDQDLCFVRQIIWIETGGQ
jgi:hypothetical protein